MPEQSASKHFCPVPSRPVTTSTRDENVSTHLPTQHRSLTEQGCREPGYAARMVLEHLRDKAELESGGFARYVSLICRTALGEK
jgi:hypothetical protein